MKTLTAQILAVLKTGDKSFDQITAFLPEFTNRQVSNCLATMVSVRGGIVSHGTKNRKIYSLASNVLPEKSGNKTPARSPMQSAPLVRDFFANWRLCSRDPFDANGLPRLIR